MENSNDLTSAINVGILTAKERNKLILYIVICMVLNLVVVYFSPTGKAEHLNGQVATENEIRRSAIGAVLYSFPILGLILAALISLIPYKKLPYSKKYFRFALVTILVIEIVMLIFSIQRLL